MDGYYYDKMPLYTEEVSPLYRTSAQAERKLSRLREQDADGDYRIVWLPTLRKWVVVK